VVLCYIHYENSVLASFMLSPERVNYCGNLFSGLCHGIDIFVNFLHKYHV